MPFSHQDNSKNPSVITQHAPTHIAWWNAAVQAGTGRVAPSGISAMRTSTTGAARARERRRTVPAHRGLVADRGFSATVFGVVCVGVVRDCAISRFPSCACPSCACPRGLPHGLVLLATQRRAPGASRRCGCPDEAPASRGALVWGATSSRDRTPRLFRLSARCFVAVRARADHTLTIAARRA
jgi:hypothetical protein